MLRNVKRIVYVKKTMKSEIFELELQEDKNILKYGEYIEKNNGIMIDNDLAIHYLDNLFRIIDGWKSKYENKNMIDGTEWKLQITYKNGEIKQYVGKNDFPANFEYLDRIKNEMITQLQENKYESFRY